MSPISRLRPTGLEVSSFQFSILCTMYQSRGPNALLKFFCLLAALQGYLPPPPPLPSHPVLGAPNSVEDSSFFHPLIPPSGSPGANGEGSSAIAPLAYKTQWGEGSYEFTGATSAAAVAAAGGASPSTGSSRADPSGYSDYTSKFEFSHSAVSTVLPNVAYKH